MAIVAHRQDHGRGMVQQGRRGRVADPATRVHHVGMPVADQPPQTHGEQRVGCRRQVSATRTGRRQDPGDASQTLDRDAID